MGIQAQNNYNITVPIAAIEPVWAEYQPQTYDFVDGKYARVPAVASVEEMVRVIADVFGNDDELPEYEVEGDIIHIRGWSCGRLGDAENLAPILARNGVTGTVHGEADGYLFLVEFANGTTTEHAGQVVFPTFTGSLY